MKLLLEMFFSFFKIGAFTIGGGYAMIPLIQRDVVDVKKWMGAEEFLDIIAIAEATPGPVAVNTATYVGYKQAGIPGVIFATLGVVLPSFIIIILVLLFFWEFRSNPKVISAFKGVRVAVVALIATTFVKMMKQSGLNFKNISIAVAVVVLIAVFDVEAILIISVAALLGILFNKLNEKRSVKK